MDVEVEERARRLRWALALEVRRIIHALETRRELLLGIWSRHRARDPFLDALFRRWHTLSFDHLSLLPREIILAMEVFHARVDEAELYFRYTEDMPTTLSEVYDEIVIDIRDAAAAAIEALDVPEITMPDADEGR